MKQSFLYFISFIILLPIISLYGCNIVEEAGLVDDSSKQACEYDVSAALDAGDYDKVIRLLSDGGRCANVLNETTKNIDLGAAYVGKAGFDIPSLINDIINAGGISDNVEAMDTEDIFGDFLKTISDRSNANGLTYLEEASLHYQEAAGNVDCSNTTQLDRLPPEQKNACFLAGLVSTAKAGMSLSMIFKGNEEEDLFSTIDYWLSNDTSNCTLDINNNGVPDSADFSSCAIDYSLDNSLEPDSPCDNSSVTAYHYGAGNFCSFGHENKNFYILEFTINANSTTCANYTDITDQRVLEYSATANSSMLVLTDGWCDCYSGQGCDPNTDADCFPCPIVINNETATLVGSFLDALNEGADVISTVISSETGEEYEVEDQINEFTKDICLESPQNCVCCNNDICHQCTDENDVENAEDLQIGTYDNGTVFIDAETQELVVDYILSYNSTAP